MALLGVGSKAAYPPILLPDESITSGFFPNGVVYFYKVYSDTFDICLRWLLSRVWFGKSWGFCSWGFLRDIFNEQSARVSTPSFLRGLRSCRQYFCCLYLTFSEDAPKWSEELECYSNATWSWGSVSIFSAVSPSSMDCLVPMFTVLEDSLKFLDGRNCNCKKLLSQEFLFFPSDVIVLWQRSSCGIFFFALWRAYYFPKILWGKRG